MTHNKREVRTDFKLSGITFSLKARNKASQALLSHDTAGMLIEPLSAALCHRIAKVIHLIWLLSGK